MGENADQGLRIEQYDPKASLADADNLVITDSADLDGLGRPKTKSLLGSILNDPINQNTADIASHRTSALKTDTDYTITNIDGLDLVRYSTGVTNRLANFPKASENIDRKITILKTDSGVGYMTAKGNGVEVFNYLGISQNEIVVELQNRGIVAKSNGTSWDIIEVIGAEIEDVSGVLELVYVKFFQGSLASASVTNIAHGVTADNIINISAAAYASAAVYQVHSFLTGSVPTASWYLSYDATNIVFAAVASDYYGRNYRARIYYYI